MKKIMVITGGSRGLGAAIARGAAREGYRVAINYLNSTDEAEALRDELSDLGSEAVAIQHRRDRWHRRQGVGEVRG